MQYGRPNINIDNFCPEISDDNTLMVLVVVADADSNKCL